MAIAYFPMFGSYEKVFESLSDAQVGALTRSCLHYFNSGEETTPPDPQLVPLFVMLCQSIDHSGAAYTQRCEKSRAAARKRWGQTDGGQAGRTSAGRTSADGSACGRMPARTVSCGQDPADADRNERTPADADGIGQVPACVDTAGENSADASACERMPIKEEGEREEKREKEGEEERKEKKKENPPLSAGGRGRTGARTHAHARESADHEQLREENGPERTDVSRTVGFAADEGAESAARPHSGGENGVSARPVPAPVVSTSVVPVQEPVRVYGSFQNIPLTDRQRERLRREIPEADEYVDRLSEHIASTGKTYADCCATIFKWVREDRRRGPPPKKPERTGSFDTDEFLEAAYRRSQRLIAESLRTDPALSG